MIYLFRYFQLFVYVRIRPSKGSLAEYGVSYKQIDLLADGSFDYDRIRNAVSEKTASHM